ncbi:ABC transporter ATP-binding protein [Beijerinckiaceae bacterium RH AL1]|nr:choline ABC transporter ATP-binding protein [Beijerinckiaceae bacterium]VVB46463.1 ABC transporter ATP-binding protein [Beijerinckiaceae bacterium RH CH11]VVB46548.1 ABC transporter ATP-binding protein [Beijerinckiaceae bacterium RH AL8]VVC55387.1 ABC transporter ATP-binding protein [Beijerinckiaceae bacterium RH AL1]
MIEAVGHPANAVELRNVDVVFGCKVRAALAQLDRGGTRDAILQDTGAVVGASDVTLEIEKGHICVLMGLSGSGKSTVLRAINGLNTVARGEVLVQHDGATVDIASCSAKQLRAVRLRTISMVFQSFGLLPWRSVRENVGFGLEIRGISPKERLRIVDEKLEMVGLSQWANKHVSELSGGMQQRVGLARAFATDADILLMDEPFSALDPLIRDKLQDDLLDLQKKLHKTIVFVSHDLAEALKIGNRIAIMEGGKVVQYGTASDIVLKPANRYVAEFVKRMNPLDVLTGDHVMTPAADLKRRDGRVLLDEAGEMELVVSDDGCPDGVRLKGREGKLGRIANGGEPAPDCDLLVAPVDLSLKNAMDLRCRTDNPLVFVDKLGRLAGLCDHNEIYRALLMSRT